MDTKDEKLLFKEDVFQIVWCAIGVLNTLGHGIVEKLYENALVAAKQIPLNRVPLAEMKEAFPVVRGRCCESLRRSPFLVATKPRSARRRRKTSRHRSTAGKKCSSNGRVRPSLPCAKTNGRVAIGRNCSGGRRVACGASDFAAGTAASTATPRFAAEDNGRYTAA
jgi:hypothetical protein